MVILTPATPTPTSILSEIELSFRQNCSLFKEPLRAEEFFATKDSYVLLIIAVGLGGILQFLRFCVLTLLKYYPSFQNIFEKTQLCLFITTPAYPYKIYILEGKMVKTKLLK